MSAALQAFSWGLVAGSALIIGAVAGYFLTVPRPLIANVMAFGSGVLISTLAFDLMDEAYRRGGFDSTSAGFLCGAIVYTAINVWLNSRGAKHRKRSGNQQPSEHQSTGSGLAIAAGSLLDGIPESIVIGAQSVDWQRSQPCGCGGHLSVQYSRGVIECLRHEGGGAISALCVWRLGNNRAHLRASSWIGYIGFEGATQT